nr:uncharacterized protein LOC123756876 [Procambarus clarkii]
MLALMQLFHSQGLTNASFWVGGVRVGVEDWWWVDGSYLTLGSAFWYPTFARRPKEVPESRPPPLHRDSTRRRRQGAHRPPAPETGRRGTSGGRAAQFRPRGSHHQKQRTSKSKFSRIRQTPATQQLKHSAFKRAKPAELMSSVQRPVALPADGVSGNTLSSGDGAPPAAYTRPSKTSTHPVSPSHASPGTRRDPKILVNHPGELEQQKYNNHREERTSDGLWIRESQGRQQTAAAILRVRQLAATSLPGGARHPRQEPLQTTEEGLLVLGERIPDQPLRAVCLWARFRHFFASCAATERLRALCEYKAGASEHKPIPSLTTMLHH